MYSQEYLESWFDKAKKYLPDWLLHEFHKLALPSSGGKARWRTQDGPTFLEKLALLEITPEKLRDISEEELRMVWLRLHQWFANAKKRSEATEKIINATLFVLDEFDRRGLNYDKDDELVQEAMKLKRLMAKEDIPGALAEKLEKLPEEVVIIPDFVCVVGSSVSKDAPNDIDILFRANRDEDGKHFLIQADNVWVPVRKVFDPDKKGILHFIDSPQGSHADYIPCYSLVLRKEKSRVKTIKADMVRLDLGCGDNKPEGYIGLDKAPGPQVDIVCDLEQGIPYPDNSVDEVRAYHVLEHLSDKEMIMSEIHRVLKPGGKLVFEVPSTKGEGAFNHPDHKSFWNKSTFAFWTQDDLLEGRPKFEVEKLEEIKRGDLVYVQGVLRKPEKVTKASLEPFKEFVPPKPAMTGYTEAYTVEELIEWAKEGDRWPLAIEPKHNGFRCIAEKKGDKLRLWFEGQYGEDQLHKFPDIRVALEKFNKDFIFDCDLGLLKDGKRVPRPYLMKFNAKNPEFAEDEEPILTIFDVPYWGEDLTSRPFEERRKVLESLRLERPLLLSPLKWCSNSQKVESVAKWAFDFPRSEGLVAKPAKSLYETDGSINDWFKLKRVVELKVIVLDSRKTKSDMYVYLCGVLPSTGQDWENTQEFKGKSYVVLGETLATSIEAKPGDILTCEILELIPDTEKKTLSWLGARVVDVDASRSAPYTASQSIDIAKRGQVLQKQAEEEGDIGTEAEEYWAQNWYKMFPPSGKGSFVYHHHWRGLSEEEIKLDEKDLLKTDHSLHGDLRFEGRDALWGFTVFIGKAEDNLKVGGDKLIALSSDDNLRGQFKLPQPRSWLRVGVDKPYVSEPGEVGATGKTFAKFFAIDHGTYEVGVWRQHMFEVFLHGKKLKGRFIIHSVPVEDGQRIWLIDKSKDQTPYAESRKLEDVIKELKQKGQRWLVWAKPGKAPVLYDVRKAKIGKSLSGAFVPNWFPEGVEKDASRKPLIAFVGASPSQVEAARQELMVGPVGKIFKERYLNPLGLKKQEVLLSNLVPIYLTDESGNVRQPTADEIQEWRGWLLSELKELNPKVVVALGRVAKDALGDLADFVLPHPAAVYKFGDKGEVARKIKQIRVVLFSPGKRVEKFYDVSILKADEERRLVYGIVLEPDTPDSQGDVISADEIEKAAHNFLVKSRVVGLRHSRVAPAEVVESYISPVDMEIGGQKVKKGSWILVTHILDDELWNAIKKGEYMSYSVGGFGIREPLQ